MGRFARSMDLFKTSFSVIKQDKELLWMPVLSFIASLIAIAGVVGIGIVSGIFPDAIDAEGNVDPVAAAMSFGMYVLLAFIQTYFFAATVAGANERLAGGDPTVGSALGKANKHLGRLFLWSIVIATVNVILQALRNLARNSRNPIGAILGSMAVSLVGVAWNLATYFVVPVLMFEDKGIGSSLKTSGSYFKKTWGESIVGEVGIGWIAGLVSFLIILVTLGLAFVGFSLAGVVGGLVAIGIGVFALIVSSIIFTVASAVYRTALYRYVSSGEASGPFQAETLAAQWRPV